MAPSLADTLEAVLREKRAALNAPWMQFEDDNVEVREIQAIDQAPERNLYVIEHVLTAGECKKIVAVAESQGAFERYTSPNSPEYAFRDHHRIKFRSQGIADVLWSQTELKRAFETHIRHEERIEGSAIGLNPELKLYRYAGREAFGRHIDGSDVVHDDKGKPMGRTEYTVLFYLTSTQGGETVFYDDDGHLVASIVPEQGRVVLHRHGDRYCLDHEALAVVEGTKYVLRSDVVFG